MTSHLRPALIGPRRRTVQWATTGILLLLPWFRPGGVSLLRIDMSTLSLHLFGQILHIEELYLLLFFALAGALGFLLLTLVFGRVWCGWGCPQTTLNDLAEWLILKLKLQQTGRRIQGPRARKLALQGAYLALSLLVASNLLWYFIEPPRFFGELLHGELAAPAGWTLVIVTTLVYLDLAFVRRLMCSEFCPYGRFQSTLADQATLTLHRPETEAPRCIECGACARSCPMGIDIRDGEQIECINCGRCLDACRTIMARRNEPGLIRYSFGRSGAGARALINPRSLLLTTAVLGLTLVLLFAISNRQLATLKVSHSYTAASRQLADGQQATFFNLWLNNRAKTTVTYAVQVRSDTPEPLTIKGPVAAIEMQPGENRRLDVAVVSSPSPVPREIEFVLVSAAQEVAVAHAHVFEKDH